MMEAEKGTQFVTQGLEAPGGARIYRKKASGN